MSDKLDKFDKVEVAVKKTTKLVVLIIGSIVTIALAVVLAWSQLDETIKGEENKLEALDGTDSVTVDTVYVKPIVKEAKVVKPKASKPKVEEPKEEPKEDLLDKTDKVLDKLNKLKGL